MLARAVSATAAICVFLGALVSCSSAPSVRDRYENLGYDAKSVFITYYPYLSPSQRDELLSDPLADPRELIQSWSSDDELNDPAHEVSSFDNMMSNPMNRKITDLQIGIGPSTGTRIPLHAFAIYAARGKRVEVTPDADWYVDSRLGRIVRKGGSAALEFDCVDSDLTVSADFLGERDASRTIQVRKPLAALELKVSEAYIGIDSGYNFQLNLMARCKDGTVSNVSCQATWKSASDAGRVEGCGNFIISSKEKLAREAAMTITASYGNLSIRKTLHPPIR